MRLFSFGCRLLLLTALGACSSEDATGADTDGLNGEEPPFGPELNPHGYPACGDDPEKQPSPCIDSKGAARCKTNTGYPGDELALCDPDAEDGFVIHFGPSDYDNPEAVKPFLLDPGGEEEFCLMVNTPNTVDKPFTRYHGRMRPNSHHLIVTMPKEHVEESETVPWVCGPQIGDRWLLGSQDPTIDVAHGIAETGAEPSPTDPDYGLGFVAPANQTLLLDFHNVNSTSEVMLREAWLYVKYADELAVQGDMISWINVGIDIPPLGHAVTSRVTCSPPKGPDGQQPEELYLALATAHAHERMTRLSLWHNHAGGDSELIYESHDWAEPGNAMFRTGATNPPLPVADGERFGGKNDYVQILPGDTLSFECEYQNNLDIRVGVGETTQQEMCNVFGMYYPTVGDTWDCLGR